MKTMLLIIMFFIQSCGLNYSDAIIEPGTNVEDYGIVNSTSLLCKYVGKRSELFRYSPNGLFGRADCPNWKGE